MVVVLEGPDCAGKTTLARALVDTLGLGYHHEGPPPRGVPVGYYYKTIFDQVSRNSRRGVVFDRLALSEEVYGPVLRGRSGFGPGEYDEFAAHVAPRAVQVLCLPPLKTCLSAWEADKEKQLLKWDWQVEAVWRAFKARRNGALLYDYTLPTSSLGAAVKSIQFEWDRRHA